jgi:hypothetical protein
MPSAHELLAARVRHIAAIRRRVVAAVLVSFAFAWGVIAWDGSMGHTTTAQVTTTSSSDSSSSSPSSGDASTLTTSQS